MKYHEHMVFQIFIAKGDKVSFLRNNSLCTAQFLLQTSKFLGGHGFNILIQK